MELLSIGQMARLHGVSEKTLRLYHRLGILVPCRIQEDTGYRYYDMNQSPQLDLIQELKSIGLSLGQIRSVLHNPDIGAFRNVVSDQKRRLLQQQRELSLCIYNAESLLRNIDVFMNKPQLGRFALEHIPARRALIFPYPAPQPEGCTAEEVLSFWEGCLRHFHCEMQRRGIPLTLFHNVGCCVPKANVLARNMRNECGFVFVDDCFHEAPTVTFPEADYMTYICDGMIGADGIYLEEKYYYLLIDEIGRQGYEIIGDYYGEVIAETAAFQYEGRDMMVRLQIPVRKNPGQAQDRSPAAPSRHSPVAPDDMNTRRGHTDLPDCAEPNAR